MPGYASVWRPSWLVAALRTWIAVPPPQPLDHSGPPPCSLAPAPSLYARSNVASVGVGDLAGALDEAIAPNIACDLASPFCGRQEPDPDSQGSPSSPDPEGHLGASNGDPGSGEDPQLLSDKQKVASRRLFDDRFLRSRSPRVRLRASGAIGADTAAVATLGRSRANRPWWAPRRRNPSPVTLDYRGVLTPFQPRGRFRSAHLPCRHGAHSSRG